MYLSSSVLEIRLIRIGRKSFGKAGDLGFFYVSAAEANGDGRVRQANAEMRWQNSLDENTKVVSTFDVWCFQYCNNNGEIIPGW